MYANLWLKVEFVHRGRTEQVAAELQEVFGVTKVNTKASPLPGSNCHGYCSLYQQNVGKTDKDNREHADTGYKLGSPSPS